ncbi:MAG: ABC transporter substrate-binding protein [Firmicutes bacterium]|nr:ABC transporter substrate-binding protein [Bacillota bacterium]
MRARIVYSKWLAVFYIALVAFTLAAAPAVHASGGSIALPIVADPTFNPWHPNAFVESVFVNRVLFAGVTKPGKDLQPAPDLAKSWEASPDGTVWTFYLRDDVVWHDGTPFTAEDVAFTFNEIVLNPELGANGAQNFRMLERVEVVDPYTVRFHLSGPFAALPTYLAYNAGILPKHIFEGKDPWELSEFNKGMPVGTGPFKVREYVSGSHVTLERFDDYFGEPAKLDFVTFKVLPDANTQVAQLLAGEIHVMIIDNPLIVPRVGRNPRVKVHPVEQVNYYYVAINHDRELFQDKRVKQALLMAIDREAIIESVLRGFGTPATGPISPALEAYYHPDVRTYPYDPDAARQLLAEAGWQPGPDGILYKNGQPLKFVLDVARTKDLEPISALLQQYWRDIGVQVDMVHHEWNAYVGKIVVQRNYDATVNWWITPADPDVLPYYHSSAAHTGFNITNYKNPELDAILERGRQTVDVEDRIQVYREFQEFVAEELPYIFLWYPQEIQARSAELQGMADLGLRDNMHYINEWYLDR